MAEIQLLDDNRYRQGLQDLADFERIWVISYFDRNPNWRPLVQPPVEDAGRYGVFATRSPHRPNPIGLSCVELVGIEDLTLHIRDHDLLDGTPVLDIKPYIPYADAFPEAKAGWTEVVQDSVFQTDYAGLAREQADWISHNAHLDIHGFVNAQLSTSPTSPQRKRIKTLSDGYIIAYRTWRLRYTVDEAAKQLCITQLYSGYTDEELSDPTDRYQDKAVHRAFNLKWPSSP